MTLSSSLRHRTAHSASAQQRSSPNSPQSAAAGGSTSTSSSRSRPLLNSQQLLFAIAACVLAIAVGLCFYIRDAPAWLPHTSQQQQQRQQQQQQSLLTAFLGYSTSSSGDSNTSWQQVGHVNSTVGADGRVHGPALGIFPRGCRWRDVVLPPPAAAAAAGAADGDSSATIPVQYEYWDAAAQAWTPQQPPACRLQGFDGASAAAASTTTSSDSSSSSSSSPPWQMHKGNPRTEVVPSTHHVTYRNLWYNNGRWYALVDSNRTVPSWKFSKNHEVTTLHVRDARTWLNTTRWRVVPGDTLLFDFIFFTHPTAIGHWWELLGPLFSVLKGGSGGGGLGGGAGAAAATEGGFKRPCDQMVLLHLKRTHLMEWVRAVMSVALGVGPAHDLPPILLQQETDHPWQQLTMPLEGVGADEWVMFDKVLIVRDLFTGGNRSFTSSRDAREFRAAVYQHYGLPAPARQWWWRGVPRVITFQRKRANRRIINEAGLLQLLSGYGEVRVVEFNSSTPFAEQLRVMRDTGVFVSAHTSNLANAVFLQPGSAVIEIIQRHWTWNKMDQSFRDHTRALGDLHHYAWRANHPNETVYYSERDAARFTSWTKDECLVEDCTEAATRVDIVVDLTAFKALLDSRLHMVFWGRSVAAAALPWPEAL